jgi:predicted glycoside hydrolase/deacetylase ChbG (UPF0249 family)
VAPVFAAVARERSLPARAPTDDARRMLRAAGVRTPDHFIDRFYADNVRFRTLEEILTGLPDGTSELMCHPGLVDDGLKAGSTYVEERQWEVGLLCDPTIGQLVLAQSIQLVGFGAL